MEDDSRFEVRLAGSGGQGLMLAGIILAEAAIVDGKNVTYTQSYGPEARGGASHSEVIISQGDIDYPQVTQADLLLCMSQESCDKYFYSVKKEGLLIVDLDNVSRVPTSRACRVDISGLAQNVTGRAITANVVALGIIVGLTGIVSQQAIEAAVTARAPRGTEEMNLQALRAGLEEAQRLKNREGQKGCV
ncbi:MAG: 2-oxoacid:acceptor oxidoreductase family protein [Chloroflexota bacterium]